MAAVLDLSAFAECHESVAGASGTITGGTKTGDIVHFHEPPHHFVQRTPVADIKLCGIVVRRFRYIVAADAGTGAAADLGNAQRKQPFPYCLTFPCGNDHTGVGDRNANEGTDLGENIVADAAAASVCRAIAAAERDSCDVLIVGRGGGASETLEAFNTEQVVMAIYNCTVPVVSAVGHETDWTLADAAADLRAPTPSAAAELAVPDVRQMLQQVQDCSRRLENAMQQQFRQKAQELERLQDRLKLQSPAHRQELAQQELCHLQKRLEAGIRQIWQQCQEQLVQQTNRLDMLSPMKILGRGYALAYHGEELVRSAAQVQSGDVLRVQLAEGEITAKVQ